MTSNYVFYPSVAHNLEPNHLSYLKSEKHHGSLQTLTLQCVCTHAIQTKGAQSSILFSHLGISHTAMENKKTALSSSFNQTHAAL